MGKHADVLLLSVISVAVLSLVGFNSAAVIAPSPTQNAFGTLVLGIGVLGVVYLFLRRKT